MPGISLRTVYQTLNDLAAWASCRLVSVGTGPPASIPTSTITITRLCTGAARWPTSTSRPRRASQIEGLDGFQPDLGAARVLRHVPALRRRLSPISHPNTHQVNKEQAT